jgi:hypothetical protein
MLVLSVVVPTRNERENTGLLIQRLEAALSDLPCELIFVDDSDDGTPQAGRAWRFAFVGALGVLVNLWIAAQPRLVPGRRGCCSAQLGT